MRRVWYVHKWHNGVYKGRYRIPVSFDRADRHAAELARRYAGFGWRYEVSGSAEEPKPTFSELGAWI